MINYKWETAISQRTNLKTQAQSTKTISNSSMSLEEGATEKYIFPYLGLESQK